MPWTPLATVAREDAPRAASSPRGTSVPLQRQQSRPGIQTNVHHPNDSVCVAASCRSRQLITALAVFLPRGSLLARLRCLLEASTGLWVHLRSFGTSPLR